jgi:hypothetical protein
MTAKKIDRAEKTTVEIILYSNKQLKKGGLLLVAAVHKIEMLCMFFSRTYSEFFGL